MATDTIGTFEDFLRDTANMPVVSGGDIEVAPIDQTGSADVVGTFEDFLRDTATMPPVVSKTDIESARDTEIGTFEDFLRDTAAQEMAAPELPEIEPTLPPPSLPSIGVDANLVQTEETARAQLAQEFAWLDNPFKSKDPWVQDVIDQMGMVWRSTEMLPSDKLARLHKLKLAAQGGMRAEQSIIDAEAAAAPTAKESMFLEESTSGDILRTVGSAATSIERMANATAQGIAEVATLGQADMDWFKENETEIAQQAAGLMNEIAAQGGEAAAVAQTLGEQLLVTALRLAAVGKIPKSPSAIINHLRLPLLTAATEPGGIAKRSKSALRMLLLSSTPFAAKPIAALTGATGAMQPIVTGLLDAGLNIGLSNLFGYYDWDNPRNWIPALATDILFAAGTAGEVREAQKIAQEAKASYTKLVGEEQAKADFAKAEQERAAREAAKPQSQQMAEAAIREVEAEANRLATEQTTESVPAEMRDKLLPAKTEESKAVEESISNIRPMEVKDAIQEREAEKIPKMETPETLPRVEAEIRAADTTKKGSEVAGEAKPAEITELEAKLPTEPSGTLYKQSTTIHAIEQLKQKRLSSWRGFVSVSDQPIDSKDVEGAIRIVFKDKGQFQRPETSLEHEHELVAKGDVPISPSDIIEFQAKRPEIAKAFKEFLPEEYKHIPIRDTFEDVRPRPSLATKLPTKLKEEAPPTVAKTAEAKIEESEKVLETNPVIAIQKAAEAHNELVRPLSIKELSEMSKDNLKTLAQKYKVETTGMAREPSQTELATAIARAQRREAQYEQTGRIEPIQNIEDRIRRMNTTLGVKKSMTPQDREDFARKWGQAEGQLAGLMAGVKEGALSERKIFDMARRENKKMTDVMKRNLTDLSKSLPKEDRDMLGKPIGEVTSFKDYQKVVGKIYDKLEGAERQTALKEIGDVVSAFRREKVTPEIKLAMLQEMASKVKTISEGESDRLNSVFENINSGLARLGIRDIGDPKDISQALLRHAKTMNMDEISTLRDNLAILKAMSDKTVQAKIKEEQEATEKRVSDATETISKATPSRAITFDLGGLSRFARSAVVNLYTRLDILDGGDRNGIHNRTIRKSLQAGTHTYDDIINKCNDVAQQITDIVDRGWGGRKQNIKVGEKELTMTNYEKVSLFLTSLRKKGLRDLTTHGIKHRETGQKPYVFTMDDVNRLWQSMTDQELYVAKLFAKGVKDILTPAQQKAYRELNYHDIPNMEDFYWRTFADKDILSETKGKEKYSVEDVGWLKPKTGGRPIVFNDAMDTFIKLAEQTGRYAGFAKPMRQIKAMLNNTKYKESVADKFGSQFYDELAEHIQRIEGRNRSVSDVERVALWGLRNISSSFINANPRTIIKQLPSLINTWEYGIPLKYVLRNLNTIVPEDEMFSNATLKRRYREQMMERETAEAAGTRGRLRSARRWMGGGIQRADRLAISRAWAATKDYLANEKGLKGDELLRQTSEMMSDIVAQTQPTSDALNQTLMQSEKGVIPKMFTLFSSQRSKWNNMVLSRAVQVANAKSPEQKAEARKALATALILYGGNAAIMSGLDVGFVKGWRKLLSTIKGHLNLGKVDDAESTQEQIVRAMEKNFMGMFPAGNELFQLIDNWRSGGPKGVKQAMTMGRFDSALESGIRDISKSMLDLFDSDKELADHIFNFIIACDRLTGLGIGVPAKYVKEAMTPEQTITRWQESNWKIMRRAMLTGKRTYDQMGEWIKASDFPEPTALKYTDRFFRIVIDECEAGKISEQEARRIIRKYRVTGAQEIKYLTSLQRATTKVKKQGD